MMWCALVAAGLTLTRAGEIDVPRAWSGGDVSGLSGLTRVADDAYYAVRDSGSGGALYTLRIGVDRVTGAPTNCVVTGMSRLAGRDDLECVAWDAGRVWVGDESDGSIRAFAPDTGREVASVKIPEVYQAYEYNRSFESLCLHPNGLEMWTCNEEALSRERAREREQHDVKRLEPGTPEVEDGPRTSRTGGSSVRLQRFTRTERGSDWKAAGQFVYETDSMGGFGVFDLARCGVADLLCLEDGTLLALEREMSLKKGKFLPSFRCRIYAIDRSKATDVSAVLALTRADARPVSKRRLYGANTGFANYEGICLGPTLADGSRCVLLVSDGDDGALNRILGLRLSHSVP